MSFFGTQQVGDRLDDRIGRGDEVGPHPVSVALDVADGRRHNDPILEEAEAALDVHVLHCARRCSDLMPDVAKGRRSRCVRDVRGRRCDQHTVDGVSHPSCGDIDKEPVVSDTGVACRKVARHLDVDGRLRVDRPRRIGGQIDAKGKLAGLVGIT